MADDKKKWWNIDLKFTLIYMALGIAMGFASYLVNVPIRAFLLMIVVFVVSVISANKIWKISEGKGWWFSKFIVYLFMWFFVWTIFHTSCSIYNSFCI